jgi:hypothetical protein
MIFLSAALAVGVAVLVGVSASSPSVDPTTAFLDRLDIARYERNGTDYTNPAYSPLRLGKPLDALDTTYDYDFGRLEQTEARLAGVNRRRVLKEIFARVREGAASETQAHLRLLKFLHEAMKNGLLQPMHRDRTAVYDPLVLLELSEARCGQIARVAADLYLAAGHRARLVQAGHHVLAEVYYDSGWHYFDGDIFGNGDTVVLPDGHIPSMAELSRTPHALDALPAYWMPDYQNHLRLNPTPYASYYYFARAAYTTRAVVYTKRAGDDEAQASRSYGWNTCDEEVDAGRKLWDDLQLFLAPGAPFLEDCRTHGRGASLDVVLSWRPSWRPAGGQVSYRVFVSRGSRGWGYNGPSLAPRLVALRSHPEGWRPDCYAARYALPPGEVAVVRTHDTSVRLTLENAGNYYISVMAADPHGEEVGRELFPLSEEIKVGRGTNGSPARRGNH